MIRPVARSVSISSTSGPRMWWLTLMAFLRLRIIRVSVRFSFAFFYLIQNLLKDFLFLVASNQPPLLVMRIFDWVKQILPHVIGIRDWPSFIKKFKSALPSIGNFFCLTVVVSFSGVCKFILVISTFIFFPGRGSSRGSRASVPSFQRKAVAP